MDFYNVAKWQKNPSVAFIEPVSSSRFLSKLIKFLNCPVTGLKRGEKGMCVFIKGKAESLLNMFLFMTAT
jgi:hypothetical protein